jgi:hypothetical protein
MEDYQPADVLRQYLHTLDGQKFRLDCGHRITFGTNLGNNLVVNNGKTFTLICSLCSYL